MSEPQVFVAGPRRRRGRPRIDPSQASSPVSTRLPVDLHDRLVQIASRYDKSVAEVARSILMHQLVRMRG